MFVSGPRAAMRPVKSGGSGVGRTGPDQSRSWAGRTLFAYASSADVLPAHDDNAATSAPDRSSAAIAYASSTSPRGEPRALSLSMCSTGEVVVKPLPHAAAVHAAHRHHFP